MSPAFRPALMALLVAGASVAHAADPRLREITYDAGAVVTVPVKRGIVTHIVLDADEAITDVGSGLGGDCTKPDAVWCIAAQPGAHNLFVKAKSGASAPNNLAVVTDRRTHAFRFVVLPDGDARAPVYRLVVKAPPGHVLAGNGSLAALPLLMPPVALPPSSQELIAERLKATAPVINSKYSIAEGIDSQDIVPTLIYDDGRFTYFRFPGNREIPSVFHVLGDGSETLVNARMEDDLLVVDRVIRRLMLRAGSAVVGVWNEAFDLNGVPPAGGTTVTGVERVLKADVDGTARRVTARETAHE